MLDTVKLLNGAEVPWEEFSKWSSHKQIMNLVGNGSTGKHCSNEIRKQMSLMKKNIPRSTEVCKKISKNQIGISKGRMLDLPIKTPEGIFANRRAFIEKLVADGYSPAYAGRKLRNWIKNFPNDYYEISNIPMHTPEGIFANKLAYKEKLIADGLNPKYALDRIYYFLKKHPDKYYEVFPVCKPNK